mgnify:FL=1
MVNPPAREAQARPYVLQLQIGQFTQHLFGRQAAGKEIKNVGHADPHSADARPPATLLKINRDSLCQFCHRRCPPPPIMVAPSLGPVNASATLCATGAGVEGILGRGPSAGQRPDFDTPEEPVGPLVKTPASS